MSIPGLLPLALSLFMWLVDTTSAYQLISETTNTTSTSTSTGNTDKIDRAHTYTYADIVFEQNDVKKLENGKHPLCARGFSADELSFLGSSDETVAFKTSLLPDFGKQYVIKIKRENAWGKFRAHKQYKNWKKVTGGQSSLQFPAFIGACPQLRMGNLTTYANIVEFGGEVSMQTLISKYLPLMSEWSMHSLMLGLTDLHMIYVRKFNYVIKSDGYKMSHTMVRKTPLLDPMYMQRTMAPVIVDYDRSLSLDDFSMETEDHPCKLHQFHRMANRTINEGVDCFMMHLATTMLELIGMQKKELYSLISNPLKEQVLASLAAFPLGPRYAPVIYEIVRPKQYEQQYAHTGETRALDIEDVNDRMYRIPMEAPLSSRSYQELDFILYSWRRDHPDAQQPAMMSFEMEHKNSLVNELHLQIFGRKAPTRIKK